MNRSDQNRPAPRTRAYESYKKLEEAQLLDKIPDRFDPNSIMSGEDDEESPRRETSYSDEETDFETMLHQDLFEKSRPSISSQDPSTSSQGSSTSSLSPSTPKLELNYQHHKEFSDERKPSFTPYDHPPTFILPRMRSKSENKSKLTQSVCDKRQYVWLPNTPTTKKSFDTSSDSSSVGNSSIVCCDQFFSMNESLEETIVDPLIVTPLPKAFKLMSLNRQVDRGVYAPKKEQNVFPMRYDVETISPLQLTEPQFDSTLLGDADNNTIVPSAAINTHGFVNSTVSKPKLSHQAMASSKEMGDAILCHFCHSLKKMTVNGKDYIILTALGVGGSCKVYAAFDEVVKNVVAIKCVDLECLPEDLKTGYEKEIEYLNILENANHVIKLFDSEFKNDEILLVMEKGDTDLAHFLNDAKRIQNLTPLMIKFYWYQMLKAVSEIHDKGIIHSDLKPANFLLVSGHLKLIDFGISSRIQPDMTSAIRENMVGTINYMSPETIIANNTLMSNPRKVTYKIGVKSDIWSLGCILYNLVYGHTPFQNFNIMEQKSLAIVDPSYAISFPSIKNKMLMDVMQRCLERDPKQRASVNELLNHPYLRMEEDPACVPENVENLVERIGCLTSPEVITVSQFVNQIFDKRTGF